VRELAAEASSRALVIVVDEDEGALDEGETWRKCQFWQKRQLAVQLV
jgi:hypothetical protein